MDKKLIVDVKKIIIKSKKTQATNSIEDLKKEFQLFPTVIKFFQKIDIDRLIINDNEFVIKFNNEFLYLDNKFINLSTKLNFYSNQVIFDLYSLYLKDLKVTLLGKIKLDYFNEKLDFYGDYIYENLKGNIKIDVKNNILTTYLNSQSFEGLGFLKKYLHLSAIANSWIYDNVKGDIKLNEFYGSFDLKNYKLLFNSLKAKGEINNAVIKFHDGVEPILSKKVEISYNNDVLSFNLIDAKYMGIALNKSSVVINNLTSEKNGEVVISLETQTILDDKIKKILDAYKITLPLTQNSGLTNANLKLKIPYDISKHMKSIGEFEVKNSEISIGNFNFFSEYAKVLLDDNMIYIKNSDFKYNELLKSKVNIDLDTKTLKSKGDILINKLYVSSDKQELINIKDFKTNFIMDLKNRINIDLIDLKTIIDVQKNINIKITDLSKIYDHSKLLEKLKITNGDLDLDIISKDNFKFITNIQMEELPLFKDGKKVEKFQLFGSVNEKEANIHSYNKDLNISISENKPIKLELKNFDIDLSKNSTKDEKIIPDMVIALENNNLKFNEDSYLISKGDVSISSNVINFQGIINNLNLPLIRDNQRVQSLDIKGKYSKDEIHLYTRSNDLVFVIKDDDVSVDLNNYDLLVNLKDERNKDNKFKKINLTAKNSNIILNESHKFLADSFELRVREDSKFFNLNYKDIQITFKESSDNKIDIFANNLNDEFINTIFDKQILKNGNFMILAKGDKNSLDGKLIIQNSKVEDLAVLNNLLLFIHTSPAIINPVLAIPSLVGMATNKGFDLTGYKINNGTIEFNYEIENKKLNIKKLLTIGNGVDFDGYGLIDLINMSLDMKVKLIFLKDYSNLVGAIPVINYLFLGDNKRVETLVDIFGALENPKISTNLTKETFSVPVNIAKRILQSPNKLLEFIKGEGDLQENELLK